MLLIWKEESILGSRGCCSPKNLSEYSIVPILKFFLSTILQLEFFYTCQYYAYNQYKQTFYKRVKIDFR